MTMQIKEIMTENPVYIEVPGTRDQIMEKINEHKHFTLPVCKAGTKELVGIVSGADLIAKQQSTQIAMLMTSRPMTVRPDDDIDKLIALILETGHRRLPVVDDGNLVGLVTVTDIRNKVIAHRDVTDPVEPYVIKNTPIVWDKTPLTVVAEQMRMFEHIKMVPCVDKKCQLTGVFTYHDFLTVSEIVRSEEKIETSSFGEGETGSWDSSAIVLIASQTFTLPDIPVSEIMSKEIITAYAGASIQEVAKKMRKNDIDAMPIINASGSLIGIIRDIDLLKPLKPFEK
ncbi:MAG: CBS domain-containing protein [Candidatus Kariarchaeaceae archaeon]